MTIPRDKLLHLALGALAILCAVVGLVVLRQYGLGALLAYTTTVVGVLYECQQQYRGEGTADVLDAVYTAAPGYAAWGVLSLLPPGVIP